MAGFGGKEYLNKGAEMTSKVFSVHNMPGEFGGDVLYTKPSRFAAVTLSDDNKITFHTTMHKCREVFISNLQHNFFSRKLASPDRLVVMLVTNSTLMSEYAVKSGIRLLNMFEDSAGWPHTVMHGHDTMKLHSKVSDHEKFHLIIGPKEWLVAPAMVSLFLLILRTGRIKYVQDVENVDDYFKVMQDVANSDQKELRILPDAEFFTGKKGFLMKTVFQNQEKVFSEITFDTHWQKSLTSHGMITDGIENLVKCNAAVPALRARFVKFCRESNISIPE